VTAEPPTQVIVGLDVGTTGVKAVAFGVGVPWRHVALREYPTLRPAPDRVEQDPAALLSATSAALAECVGAAGAARVLAVCVSAGMHGLMALDSSLHPLTPLITWADSRAREEAKELHESGRAHELYALTGVPVHPMSPLTRLLWFARHDPATWAAARWWVGLKDYILLWLTGALVTELSSASGTGLLDMASGTWSSAALEVSDLSAGHLPEILPTTSVLGLAPAAARLVHLPPGTPIVVGAADGPLGNLGTGAMAPGVAGLSLGTSGAVRIAVSEPRIDPRGSLFCYALTHSTWVVGSAISTGGAVVRWAGGALVPDVVAVGSVAHPDEAVLTLAASVPPGSEGLVMLPYLLAERAPLWDPDLRGAYVGLRWDHTRAHMVRAGLEGVCLQMRIIVDMLDDVEPVRSVRATGGVFRSALWREVMAAMLGRPLRILSDAEGSALGAAALGLSALGLVARLSDGVALLGGASASPAIDPDPRLVAAYDELRASVPELIGRLSGVAAILRRPGARRDGEAIADGAWRGDGRSETPHG